MLRDTTVCLTEELGSTIPEKKPTDEAECLGLLAMYKDTYVTNGLRLMTSVADGSEHCRQEQKLSILRGHFIDPRHPAAHRGTTNNLDMSRALAGTHDARPSGPGSLARDETTRFSAKQPRKLQRLSLTCLVVRLYGPTLNVPLGTCTFHWKSCGSNSYKAAPAVQVK